MRVRERPPLRYTIEVETPGGGFCRWAADAPLAADVPSELRHSSTMPGGFESLDCSLPRRAAGDHPDLERGSTVRVRSIAEIVGEYRLERSPRVSGDRVAVSPSGVGYQAHLDDDKSASIIFVDRDMSAFAGDPSAQRRANLGSPWRLNTGSNGLEPDQSGTPRILQQLTRLAATTGAAQYVQESWYDAGPGNRLGALYYDLTTQNIGADWDTLAILSSNDQHSATNTTGDLGTTASGYLTTAASRRFATLQLLFTGTTTADGDWQARWRRLAAYGDHGLTRRGSAPGGLLASDMIAFALAQWAPELTFTTGVDGTIQPSTFVIPHAVFRERGGIGPWMRELTRYELLDWAVWEGKTFYLNERGARGRNWHTRVAPAGLEETGPQMDRLWESVMVQYRDVDGTTRTVGPPGSGADTESADLHDDDPENPANKLGIIRRDLLQMGTSTAGAAIVVGQRFLEETKLLDSSGRARLAGHVEDESGVWHPFSHVRAGDTITFLDAADTSPRRIVRADHSHAERACQIDIDAPPEGLQALLERLGVVLTPLGL